MEVTAGNIAAGEIVERLRADGVRRGDLVGAALAAGTGLGIATAGGTYAIATAEPAAVMAGIEAALGPRWVVWSNRLAVELATAGHRLERCWDLRAVHRLLFGGWRAGPELVWARLHGLTIDERAMPARATMQPDLFSTTSDAGADPAGAVDGGAAAGAPAGGGPADGGWAGGDGRAGGGRPSADEPVRGDGHLGADWVAGGWAATSQRLARWAALALETAGLQQAALAALVERPAAASTARSESAAELLCAELEVEGLPMDRGVAESIIAGFVGERPRSDAHAAEQRAERDAVVLRHAPPGTTFLLRNPAQVRSLLRAAGIEVPDTRAWRLESMRDAHPLIDDLLAWRAAERVSTTFGYAWLDQHLGADGRLRGEWSGADGAAGRMTATAGLHNMPAEMRPAVVAEPGHVFVRADLGQIEPRVLAAVAGDAALAGATRDADMYAPVATALGVDRPTAKVAVLGAMYGQTTGHGAVALRRLEGAYPVAMGYLHQADIDGQVGRDIRTYGGRLVRMGSTDVSGIDDRDARSNAAARGRYGRNATVQGAAAELFKVWAVTVRARATALDARIVLCLHDELLVHAPVEHGDAVAALLADCLQEAASRWSPSRDVRFVADIAVITRWSDAKP